MKGLLFSISTLLLLASCAGESKKVKARISLGSQMAMYISEFPGGLYVLGHNTETDQAFVKKLESTSYEIELDNGIWEFGAIGWDASNSPFDGIPKCFMRPAQKLEGDQDIILTIDTAGCGIDPFFKEPFNQTSGTPKELQFVSCAGLSESGTNENNITDGDTCNSNPGKYKSFQFVMHDIPLSFGEQFQNNLQNPVASRCISTGANHFTSNSNLFIPIFEGIPQTVMAFESSNCSGSPRVTTFRSGLAGDDHDNNNTSTQTVMDEYGAFVASSSASTLNRFYIDNDICDASAIANVGFEKGTGTQADPFIVCAGQDLSLITSNPALHYKLGTDLFIDKSPFTTVPADTPFTGSLDGNTYTINRLNKPLFERVDGGARITDLVLRNVNISTSSQSLGTIANIIEVPTMTSVEIKNIVIENIQMTNTVQTTMNTCGTGLIAGKAIAIETDAKLNISDINIFSTTAGKNKLTTNDAGGSGCDTGGVIGNANGEVSADLTLENIVISRLQIENTDDRTGGLIGNARRTNVSKAVVNQTEVSGYNFVGGILGRSDQSHIQFSTFSANFDNGENAQLNCISPTAICNNYGGMIGRADNGHTTIKHATTAFKINDNTHRMNQVGGIVGSSNSGGSFGNGYSNLNSYVLFYFNGMDVGGLIGRINEVGYSAIGDSYISSSLAQGQMLIASNQTLGYNDNRGGIVGNFNSSAANQDIKMIIAKMQMTGNNRLGGIVGRNTGIVREAVFEGSLDLITTTTEGNYSVGGVVAENTTSGQLMDVAIRNAQIGIDDANLCNYPGQNEYCGLIVGLNDNPNNVDQNTAVILANAINSGLFDRNDNPVAPIYISGPNNTTATTSSFGSGTNTALTDTFGNSHMILVDDPDFGMRPWHDNSGEYVPLFHHKWNAIGYDGTSNRYLAGNLYEPFEINTVAKWNMVSDDAFLLSKAFVLTSPLDFNGQTFVPFGANFDVGSGDLFCGNNTFTGILMGKKPGSSSNNIIRNITLNLDTDWDFARATCSTRSMGMFAAVGDSINSIVGVIGTEDAPLIIQNIDINYNTAGSDFSSIGALIGDASMANVNVDINDVNIDLSGSTIAGSAGGIIGQAETLRLMDSVATNITLNSNYVQNLGGIIGDAAMASGSYHIENLYTENLNISAASGPGGSFAGGLIGTADSADTVIATNNTFKNLTLNGGNLTVAGGFIGNLANTNFVLIESNAVYPNNIVGYNYSGGFIGSGNSMAEFYIENNLVQFLANTNKIDTNNSLGTSAGFLANFNNLSGGLARTVKHNLVVMNLNNFGGNSNTNKAFSGTAGSSDANNNNNVLGLANDSSQANAYFDGANAKNEMYQFLSDNGLGFYFSENSSGIFTPLPYSDN